MSVFFIFAENRIMMIIVIGADGFLGGRMVAKLRDTCFKDFISETEILPFSETDEFFQFLPSHYREVEWVIYCDKRTLNTEISVSRYESVQKLWTVVASYSIPLLYAFHQPVESPVSDFQPDCFVKWSGKQYRRPPFWYIFKVGEVYGRQENCPDERISRVYDFYRQIVETGEAVLPTKAQDVDREGVMRDYLYVQDAVRVFYWFMQHHPTNGVYDLGSGFERSDLAVVNAIFRALKLPPHIRYSFPNPKDSATQLASFQPNLQDLRRAGYRKPFYSVEKGIKSFLRLLP